MIRNEYMPLLRRVEKPGRYTGGEYGSVIKDKKNIDVRFCFCFPDTYEIGMSNLGIKILADTMNALDYCWCERSYAPWSDFEKELRENGLPLYALESGDPLGDFDIVGFTLQYELSYSNVVNMLELSGIPAFAADRGEDYPIIIGGGPCTYNPEPVADFFDVFAIGEGEYMLTEFCALYRDCRKKGMKKSEILRLASHLDGFYVPSLYDVAYNSDGTINAVTPKYDDVPPVVTKRIVEDLDSAPFPTDFPVPYLETVHDRVTVEVFRGCIRGCRFCQAGMVYRPYREKSSDSINACAMASCRNTGYNEISLSALSISDYSEIDKLVDKLLSWTENEKISLSLPSMRIDAFYEELMKKVMSVRKSGLTFAPEAGTQRLRDVINKNITEEEILSACKMAFDRGRSQIKLYFMLGLPTETDEDLTGIAALGQSIVDEFFSQKRNGKYLNITLSVASFVPKPFTPFQWQPQQPIEEIERRQQFLKGEIKTKKITYNYHDARTGRIEAMLAKGDRRQSAAIYAAVKAGQRLDGWDEFFSYDAWIKAFTDAGLDPDFYACRTIPFEETLPWDHIDCGVSKEFLIREAKKAANGLTTPDCRTQCSACGANKLGGKRRCCR